VLEKVQADRLKKLEAIRELGIDPYGGRHDTAEPIARVLARYEAWEAERGGAEAARQADDHDRADAAGRLVLVRDMGKLIFAHLRDESAPVQIALRKNALDETAWKLAKLLDLGDLIAVGGPVQRTKTGEITIWAEGLRLLAKSLNPMPEKYHGLTDVEARYRQRYLDLMTNPEAMGRFRRRIEIIELFRRLLRERGFVEVETPVFQPIYGGGAAMPFTTHYNALGADFYLRISPELYLKRLLVGGFERVYEFAHVFRNEGIDSSHSPEYTLFELYQAYADYTDMMELTEALIAAAAREVAGGEKLPYGDVEIDYTTPWRRATYAELLREHTGVELGDEAALREKARQLGIEESNKDAAVVADELFAEAVEPHLVQPTFVLDYPAALCPLTRRKAGSPDLAERFELYVATMEIANAYTELNDPAVQEANFRQQLRGEAAGETMRVMDEDFITALRHGMPPAGGLGIGVDRVIMLLTNTQSIRDVILFPMLRPEGKS
jgi:lysyl-tRNA synthetase class 2